MNLLRQSAEQGYPADYLLSRIKGRRSGLVKDWRTLMFEQDLSPSPSVRHAGGRRSDASSDRIWEDLLEEHEWAYGQMNAQLRSVFAPYFLHAEMRTLFLCLRRVPDAATGVINELLDHSLLSHEVKVALVQGEDLQSAIKKIERLFVAWSGDFMGLTGVLPSEGRRGVEQRLADTTLIVIARSGLHPLMKTFFSRLIDARNSMRLFKYARFERASEPRILPGGTLPLLRLREVMKQGDPATLRALIREATGIDPEKLEPTQVERALYQGLTLWLRKLGREPFGIPPILDYLWRCSIEAMNLSVLHHTRGLERDLVAAELVM